METCFVIQPFDKGIFDQRYTDTFEPAIKASGLEPYRVDRDPSVRIPIEEIEEGIRKAALCFAELTSDNPNVWYELGYAVAMDKDVIMVTEERQKFPFDIQHRHIITYKTSSKSDFELLEQAIKNKIEGLQQKSNKLKKLQATPVVDTEGLKGHEVAIIIILAEHQLTNENVAIYDLKGAMNQAGYTDLATKVGLTDLGRKGLISTLTVSDMWNEPPYVAARLTEEGENWLMTNQDKLVFRLDPSTLKNNQPPPLSTDLPF